MQPQQLLTSMEGVLEAHGHLAADGSEAGQHDRGRRTGIELAATVFGGLEFRQPCFIWTRSNPGSRYLGLICQSEREESRGIVSQARWKPDQSSYVS